MLVNNNDRILSRRLKKTQFEREKMYKANHEVRRLKRAVNTTNTFKNISYLQPSVKPSPIPIIISMNYGINNVGLSLL